jgi:hypothetical protein
MQSKVDMVGLQIVPWVLVIVGWWFVNSQNNIREKRKEIRTLMDKIQSLLDDIESQAIQYHTSEESSDLAFQLKRSLNQKLSNRLEILKLRSLNVDKCYSLLKQFRQAVTLENFDTKSFKPQNISDDLITKIWLAKDKLSYELEKSFASKYR